MVTVQASDLDAILHLSGGVDDQDLEAILDQAIDKINLYGHTDISNMTGTAGSKTVNLESREKAAVFMAARAVYYGYYKGLESSSVGGLTVGSPDLESNPAVERQIKEAARLLTELEVDVG